MKFFLILLSLIFIISCQSPPIKKSTKTDSVREEIKPEVLISLIRENFEKVGAAMVCDQPEYLKCYSVSKSQCLLDLEESSGMCLDSAFERVDSRRPKEELQRISQHYGVCLAVMHAREYPDNMDEIELCISKYEVDQEILLETMSY